MSHKRHNVTHKKYTKKDLIGDVIADYETKINSKWRPMMAWLYMLTCAFDFIIAPIIWSSLLAFLKQPVTLWSPLTLQGGGLFHVAMGAVIGISSYGRSQERLNAMSIVATASPNYAFPNPQEPVTPDDSNNPDDNEDNEDIPEK